MTMFAEKPNNRALGAEREPTKRVISASLTDLNEKELLLLHEDVLALLPIKHLKDLDLSSEMIFQYQKAKILQTEVLESHDESNKKAQVLNACASALQSLVKMQAEFYTTERLKKIESLLIKSLQDIPREQLEAFFAAYESDEFKK